MCACVQAHVSTCSFEIENLFGNRGNRKAAFPVPSNEQKTGGSGR